MKRLFQQRFPIYFGGFLLGMTAVMLLLQAKRATAPKFEDVEEERKAFTLSRSAQILLSYQGDPEMHLPPGFPSQLFVAKKTEEGRFKPFLRLEYKELTEPKNLLGPFEEGSYELRALFFICPSIGAAECVRLKLFQPFEVKEETTAKEQPLVIDLEGIAKRAIPGGN